MLVCKVGDAPLAMKEGGVTGRRLYARPEVGIVHMTLEVGAAVAPHSTPFDVEFYVISGEGVAVVGGEEAAVGPGPLVLGPANLPHGLRNAGAGPMQVLVLKTPNPAG